MMSIQSYSNSSSELKWQMPSISLEPSRIGSLVPSVVSAMRMKTYTPFTVFDQLLYVLLFMGRRPCYLGKYLLRINAMKSNTQQLGVPITECHSSTRNRRDD
jgi:hypothetical protein